MSETRAGTCSTARPIRHSSRVLGWATCAGLTCTTQAPARCAMMGISAAGRTTPDVPIDSRTSHSFAARTALFQAAVGRSSPNHTTPGRSFPLQRGQRGGSILRPSLATGFSKGKIAGVQWQAKHFGCPRLPCRWMTFVEPARS
jgi:hypothetical protein